MTMQFTSEQIEQECQKQADTRSCVEACFEGGVAIYGAGFVGEWACSYLQSQGARITKFFDRHPQKIGTELNGIPIVGPTKEELGTVSALFIAARHAVRDVERDMAPFDFPSISFDGYFVLSNYPRLAQVRDQYFEDDRSVEVFNGLLMAMLTGDVAPCLAVMEKDMYFCLPEFSGNFDEVFVDAGAFVGDTVERFIWENLGTFRHIYAFEPGYKQFTAMKHRLDRLEREWAFDPGTVSLIRAGLSDREGKMACTFLDDAPLRHGLSALDPKMADDQDDNSISSIVTLDAYLDGRPVSFLKADVEGMEMELLRGAEQMIRQCRPKMALCVYHYPSHLYEIAEYVRSIVPEYKFSLRQHAPLFGDFVLYCWI